jgi:membrane-associated HD superfamily phosphohydrolase
MYVKTLTAIALCAASAFATAQTSATAMTKAEYSAAKDRIEMDYKNTKKSCDAMKDNAKDICQVEAKGKEKVEKAELENKYKPTATNGRKLEEAKADSAYDLAKEKCEDQAGDAAKVCKADAKAAHERAINTARGKA